MRPLTVKVALGQCGVFFIFFYLNLSIGRHVSLVSDVKGRVLGLGAEARVAHDATQGMTGSVDPAAIARTGSRSRRVTGDF